MRNLRFAAVFENAQKQSWSDTRVRIRVRVRSMSEVRTFLVSEFEVLTLSVSEVERNSLS